MNFECYSSDMFKTFVSQFVDKSSKLDPPDPLACWISRQGRGLRSASNFNEVMGVMKEVFTNARELRFTKAMSIDDVANALNDCRVIFGIHGAGHMNALFARPGVAVIEIVGKDNPAYFRNINMLLGQNYQRIAGDATRGIQDDGYVIDLEEAREALMKARDHAASWIEEHGHWR
jgi:capsular polysaccharide biosynthesis protein